MSSPGYSRVSSRNVRSFGPAVWPATGNMYRRVLFYYIDIIECRVYINKTKPGAATRWVYFYKFYCLFMRVLFNIQLTQYLSDLGLQEAAICNLSPKFKRVSLNETPEFHIRGLNISVDFDLSN